jgi:polyhydroxyalkanoate synthesis regulator phasin
MLELLKKTVFAGIGAAVTTKERVQSMLHELVEQGRLTQEEAERMAEKIARDGKAEFERTKEEISNNLQQVFGKGKVVKESEYRKLELRVSILEEKEAARNLSQISRKKAAEAPGDVPPPPPSPL